MVPVHWLVARTRTAGCLYGDPHRLRPACPQDGHPADVPGLLADADDVAPVDVVDNDRVDACPGHQRVQHLRGQVNGVQGRQPPASLPDGAADGVDDHCITHLGSF